METYVVLACLASLIRRLRLNHDVSRFDAGWIRTKVTCMPFVVQEMESRYFIMKGDYCKSMSVLWEWLLLVALSMTGPCSDLDNWCDLDISICLVRLVSESLELGSVYSYLRPCSVPSCTTDNRSLSLPQTGTQSRSCRRIRCVDDPMQVEHLVD